METAQFAILAGLSAISLAICAYLLLKVRTITYLLEQPVVKKMSPQLKLKPVKVDEMDGESRPAQAARNAPPAGAPNRGPRPAFEGGERPPRDNQSRDRAPRGEGEPRREGFDRGPRNDRGDRGDRFGGGRDRGGRGGHERHDRGPREGGTGGREGGDRDRNRAPRTEPFSAEREAAPVEGGAPRPAPMASESSQSHSAPAALSPRRPLPSTVDQEVVHKEIPLADAQAANAAAEDALFARDESDMQHGRRHQPKKKPRFNVEESEVKTEETKA
jgi:hypothetical protein